MTGYAEILSGLNPTLPLHAVLLQIAPSNYLHGLGKHRFNCQRFNRGSGFVELPMKTV
jgi:hypothetical protein